MQGFVTSSFRPHRNGLNQVLGELEQEIMEFLWENGEAIVRDVLLDLKKKRKIAYTTVMTVMGRLANKGLLSKLPVKNTYLYKPACTKEAFERSVSREVLMGVLGNYPQTAFTSFIDIIAEMEPEQMEYLSNLIEEKKGELRKRGR
ncbi:MAG: BlaI/MecI/CopY family transcriptional regulator [Nitrospirota bacterium]